MCDNHLFYSGISEIYSKARESDDGMRCMVAPSPDLNEKIRKEIKALAARKDSVLGGLALRASEPKRDGFNDGLIIPPSEFPIGTAPSVIRNAAMERAPLRGTVRVIVVLVDFSDKPMVQTKQHFVDLFFSNGVIPTKSVREYFADVTNGLVDLQGDVVGPFRMPQTLATYAHGAAGIGNALPNARTMAKDALNAANPTVNFAPYDNDGNGFVDAFIVIHSGSGGEQSGSSGDIWSHKWVLDGGEATVDGTKVFAYLTVPEDCRIGVCAHELGHLLFGFPDLYDTDGSSEGIGNFCLMAGGSWGGGGNTPVHPSAWCKANQGWASVDNVTSNGPKSFQDVKDSNVVTRLWKDGGSGSEYFLAENRQKTGFDASLPGGGLLIWHIDEAVSTNTNESHYKVALIQADNQKQMESGANRGDAGDPYPGTSNNSSFSDTSSPNSKSYAGQKTCVSITGISSSSAVMTANVTVKCFTKIRFKEFQKDKEFRKESRKDFVVEKPNFDKKPEKPIIDKSSTFDKNTDKVTDGKFTEKLNEGKFGEKLGEGGGLGGGGGGLGAGSDGSMLEQRVLQLEAIVGAMMSGGDAGGGQNQPFIGSELRPDLSTGAFMNEDDQMQDQMRAGAPQSKRLFDTKRSDI